MQMGGSLRLASPGLSVESVLEPLAPPAGAAPTSTCSTSPSRVSTLETLGSYRLNIAADPSGSGASQLTLSTSRARCSSAATAR